MAPCKDETVVDLNSLIMQSVHHVMVVSNNLCKEKQVVECVGDDLRRKILIGIDL